MVSGKLGDFARRGNVYNDLLFWAALTLSWVGAVVIIDGGVTVNRLASTMDHRHSCTLCVILTGWNWRNTCVGMLLGCFC